MKKSSPMKIGPSNGLNNLYDYTTMAMEPLWFLLEKMEEEQGSSYILVDPVLREVYRRISGALEAIKRDVGDINIHFTYAKRHIPETVLGAQLDEKVKEKKQQKSGPISGAEV